MYYEVENLSSAENEEMGKEGATENGQEIIAPQTEMTADSDSDDADEARTVENGMVFVGWMGSSFVGMKTMKKIFWGIVNNGYVVHR